MPQIADNSATNRLNQLPNSQLELIGGDVDIGQFKLTMRNLGGIKLESAIVDTPQVNRTIEGASTITIPVDDDIGRTIQRSGLLGRGTVVNINGLWWTLVGETKQGRRLDLKFEEREVNVLRHYNSFLQATRDKMTRAQFVIKMLQEPKEIQLRYFVEDPTKKQLISDLQPGQTLIDKFGNPLGDFTADPANEKATRAHGIPTGVPTAGELLAKGEPVTPEQINVANTILRVGEAMGARRKVLVTSIMVAIAEPQPPLTNDIGGDRDSVGVFQQRRSQGWPATRNIPVDAAEFFNRAIALDQREPNLSLNDLAQGVQHSGTPYVYGQYEGEANAFVLGYGISGSTFADPTPNASNNMGTPNTGQAGGTYQFTRGTLSQDSQGRLILTKENTWQCLQRLASEVNWRCFCCSGTIYFVSEATLFEAKPFMTISEDSLGVQEINYDYDEGKRAAEIQVLCHLSRWSAPPGSIVKIVDQGVVDGKWLVNDVSRPLTNTEGIITLKKPLPVLPEPIANASAQLLSIAPEPAIPGGQFPGAGTGEAMNDARQKSIVAYAKSQLGVPYAWGAETPGVAFDCSGLTEAAYDQAGVDIPRVAQDQFNFGPLVSGPLQPGDLVFFSHSASTSDVGHVGIYIGDGQMIDAPQSGYDVRVNTNWNPTYGTETYVGATRAWASR